MNLQGAFNPAAVAPKTGYLETRLQLLVTDKQATAADLQKLIDEGVNLECRYERNQTPLILAASKDNTAMVEALASAGAKMDAADEAGATALFYCVAHYNEDGVKILLDKGLHPDHARYHGMTALMHAANFNKPDIVAALLLHGADHHLKSDGQNMTAAEYAEDNNKKHLSDKIKLWGADRDAREAEKKRQQEAQAVQTAKEDENARMDALQDQGMPTARPVKAMAPMRIKRNVVIH